MQIEDLPLQGLKLIRTKIWADERGFFVERYREDLFKKAGITAHFPQDNHSRSIPRVIRGLHFQRVPSEGRAQGKLVGVTRGRIWDVAVDIRKDSPTFGRHFGLELSEESGLQLWIPGGFAHGFCVLGDVPADVVYKVDSVYSPGVEGAIDWADPELAIAWPTPHEQALISPKDMKSMSFADYRKAPWF